MACKLSKFYKSYEDKGGRKFSLIRFMVPFFILTFSNIENIIKVKKILDIRE